MDRPDALEAAAEQSTDKDVHLLAEALLLEHQDAEQTTADMLDPKRTFDLIASKLDALLSSDVTTTLTLGSD